MNGIIGIIVALVLAAGGGWLYMQKRAVEKAELARDAAIVQRDEVAVQRDRAIESSRENEATITELQREKQLVNQALNTLQAQKQVIIERTVVREQAIQGNTLPSSRETVPPVIAQVIQQIQADRIQRRLQ